MVGGEGAEMKEMSLCYKKIVVLGPVRWSVAGADCSSAKKRGQEGPRGKVNKRRVGYGCGYWYSARWAKTGTSVWYSVQGYKGTIVKSTSGGGCSAESWWNESVVFESQLNK